MQDEINNADTVYKIPVFETTFVNNGFISDFLWAGPCTLKENLYPVPSCECILDYGMKQKFTNFFSFPAFLQILPFVKKKKDIMDSL